MTPVGKRGYGMATVRRRTWRSAGEVRTTWLADYFDQERKRHQVAFKTKKEADAFLVQARDELRRMLEHAKGRWRTLVVTAIFTGLRASELRGLRWDPDVDLDRGVLRVRQRADRWNTIGSPKSDAGKRDVPLAPMVVNTLRN